MIFYKNVYYIKNNGIVETLNINFINVGVEMKNRKNKIIFKNVFNMSAFQKKSFF